MQHTMASVTSMTCVCVQICLWRYDQASEQSNVRNAAPASNTMETLVTRAKAACNSLVLEWLPSGDPAHKDLHIMSAYEDGSIMHQAAGI